MNNLGGGEDFVDSFVGSSQNLTLFRSHFYAFYGQHGGIFLVAKISNIFGVLEIPDIFFWGGGGER